MSGTRRGLSGRGPGKCCAPGGSTDTLDPDEESQGLVSREELEQRQRAKETGGGETPQSGKGKGNASTDRADATSPADLFATKHAAVPLLTTTPEPTNKGVHGTPATGQKPANTNSKPAAAKSAAVKMEVKSEGTETKKGKGSGLTGALRGAQKVEPVEPKPELKEEKKELVEPVTATAHNIAQEVNDALRRASTTDNLEPSEIPQCVPKKQAEKKERDKVQHARRERFYKSLVSSGLRTARKMLGW